MGGRSAKKRTIKDKKTGENKEVFANLSYHGELLAAVTEAWRVTQRDKLKDQNCDLLYAVEVMKKIQVEFIDQMHEIERAEIGGDGDA